MRLGTQPFLLVSFVLYLANAQNGIETVSSGLDQFALKLLTQTAEAAGDNLNIALSPFTIWTLLTIISEGANKNTLRELENSLGIPAADKSVFRNNFRALSSDLKRNADGVTLDITNAIFTTNEFPLNTTFQAVSQSTYGVDVIPVDFRNSRGAVNTINNYISRATQNRIPNFVNAADVADAAIFMTSALFFKGQWRYRFDSAQTKPETFYNDAGNSIGRVQMMYQSGPFPYTLVSYLNAHAVELPYGNSDKVSMIVIVPRKGVKLLTVLRAIASRPVSELLNTLDRVQKEFSEEEVDVYLPKFKIESELNLNGVLNKMGINEVFNSEKADLLGIFPQYLYLSRVLQKAVIDVDEEGTIAAAAAGASIVYKTTQPKISANKPFAFFIVDKSTRSIIFAGKVSNPNGICDKCTGN
ncbi:PREDICTED: antichymotrypsin-2-like isoform X2 [Nicrophorus vespilloides]|uniref:Antichymotrypsin-2-like isoform X2 n=1 Tax=Nicrophorus vespilloides TaxID=110193 RepID=A0ABM1MTG6_NICVS|nr:PREDICTED: antichymotrypsin-2-like isoform X2 [Nicrophorus vespilloides]